MSTNGCLLKMNAHAQEDISAFLNERIAANDFPSAVYLVAEKGEIVFQDALGFAVVEPERIPATMDTIYDLASLTKVLVTGLLTAVLVVKGELELEGLAAKVLPRFGSSKNSDVTIRQLLTHTSGFPAWLPFYLMPAGRDIEATIADASSKAGQEAVTYSDLNFLTLQIVVEKIFGQKIHAAAERIVFAPLGLRDTFYNPSAELKSRIAASEKGNEYEKKTCVELGYLATDGQAGMLAAPVGSAFRNQQIWGEVHDGNAYFMGGVAGHAGLFSTAGEVFKIAEQFLPNYTKILKPETCELFRTNFTPGLNEDRSFAFQLASTKDSTAGTKMPPESFGHLGFTGTSLWIDPVNERIFILLTNRTHHHELPFVNINSVRRKFHDLAIDSLQKK